jgi:hypothetical protein
MSANCADREVYTVRIDSFGVTGNYSTFQAFLDVPLRNVVKAELLMASFRQQYSNAICHVYVEELISKFITRAGPNYTIGVGATTSNVGVATQIANKGLVDRAFVTIPTSNVNGTGSVLDYRIVWKTGNEYPANVEYINPIRQLKTLTFQFLDGDTGLPQTMDKVSHFVFRFECAKDNVCLY